MATKAATAAVESAAAQGVAGARKAPFKVGRRELFVPNHVVALLRPKPGQSPTTATFKVPLTFNKLDLRDYLYHLYNVEVTSVRSFINQMLPQQRTLPGGVLGQWYRPRSQKLMVVDLKKPFVWPERPSEAEMEPWDHKLFRAVEDGHDKDVREATVSSSSGQPKLRPQKEVDADRQKLRNAAKDLLSGSKKWVPGTWAKVGKGQDVQERGRAETLPDPGLTGETNQAKDVVERS